MPPKAPSSTPNKKYRKGAMSDAERVSFYMPKLVWRELRIAALEQDCSMSWLINEAIMRMLGINQVDVDDAKGFAMPKTFSERRNNPNWTPNKQATLPSPTLSDDIDMQITQDMLPEETIIPAYCSTT